jgi:hypothetical protein
LTQSIGSGTYNVTIPALSDNASIVDAFKYYHQGGTSGSPSTNSVEQYFININNRAQYLENVIGYTTTNPINSGTTNPTYTLNARVTTLETTVGTSLASTYVKMQPSSNSVDANRNIIIPTTALIVPLTIQGYPAQTASLQEWQTSAATVAKVDSTGKMFSYDGTSMAQVATISGTQTFTNKTLTTPIQTIGTNAKTASYTLTQSDQSKVIEVNSASATTITIPDESVTTIFPIGTYIVVLQVGTGQVTIAGSGFTPNSTPGLKTRTQWSMATLIKRGTNSWVIAGDLTA